MIKTNSIFFEELNAPDIKAKFQISQFESRNRNEKTVSDKSNKSGGVTYQKNASKTSSEKCKKERMHFLIPCPFL